MLHCRKSYRDMSHVTRLMKDPQLVLVWTPGKGSPVHDHADAHCLMKILRGSLMETRYDFPDTPGRGPQITKETRYKENEVTYMSDELGLHKISNPDPNITAVSLHRRDDPFKTFEETC